MNNNYFPQSKVMAGSLFSKMNRRQIFFIFIIY